MLVAGLKYELTFSKLNFGNCNKKTLFVYIFITNNVCVDKKEKKINENLKNKKKSYLILNK